MLKTVLSGAVLGASILASLLLLPDAEAGVDDVLREDVRVDATQRFALFDRDGSGSLSADEFASASLVEAELARFSGIVTLETQRAATIRVPEDQSQPIRAAEMTRIDAVARVNFYQLATDGREMSAEDWLDYRMDQFQRADRDADGRLSRAELDSYALVITQAPGIVS